MDKSIIVIADLAPLLSSSEVVWLESYCMMFSATLGGISLLFTSILILGSLLILTNYSFEAVIVVVNHSIGRCLPFQLYLDFGSGYYSRCIHWCINQSCHDLHFHTSDSRRRVIFFYHQLVIQLLFHNSLIYGVIWEI